MPAFFTIAKKLWPSSIRSKLIAGIALVHLLLMTIFIFYLLNRQRVFLKKQNHAQVLGFANNYALNSSLFLISNDFDELERITLARTIPNLKYAMILSPEGTVLAHSNTEYIGKKATDDISRKLKGLHTITTLIENDNLLDIAVPIFIENSMVGWARVGVGQENIHNNLNTIVMDGIVYIIIALIAGTLLAIIIGNRLTAGLYKLVSTANQIKSGNRNVRIAPFKDLELQNLGIALNQMLNEISHNENLLAMVIENMPVGVWILNADGEIILGNSTGKQIWSGSKHIALNEYAVYKGWYSETKSTEPEHWPVSIALKEGKTTINEEIEIEMFDGKQKMVLSSAIPLRGKDGAVIGAIGIDVDITERKKIVQQLALSESTLNSAFNYSAIGMSLVSTEGKFLKVNRELCKMVGYPEDELIQLTFQDITHPDDLNADLALLNQTLEGKIDSYRMEKRYFRKNGSIVWVHLTVSLVRDGQNNPLFFVSQIEDITERKKSEAQIRESEEKFRQLVEETLVGVFILQHDKFVYVNPQFEKITGYPRAEVLNQLSFGQLMQGDGAVTIWRKYFTSNVQEKPTGHFLLEAVKKGGALLKIEVILSPIKFEDKPAYIGTIIDITRQVEEEIRINKAVTDAQEKERQQISMELHDNVKQIMAGCLLNIDFMKMIVKDEHAEPVINNIKEYIRNAIEELRRITHKLAPSVDASVSFQEKIRTVVDTMNVSNDIDVNYHFDESEDISTEIQLVLYRIVQEQLSNILKHARASVVYITVRRRGGDICMSIEDNGIGFDAQKTKNGIGLENIRRRVQALRGNFSIHTMPGNGCRLFVQLPVSKAVATT